MDTNELNQNFLRQVKETFVANADRAKAVPMKKYMKDQFEFLGIQTPTRRQLQKELFKKVQMPGQEQLNDIVKELWAQPEREYQYFGVRLEESFINRADEQDIELFEFMITEKSWWDTVDAIAINLVGVHFKRIPGMIPEYTEKWMASGNMWLQRTALLFQLMYKKETNVELMFDLIRRLAESKEFFIRKAIGWVLREYSKTDPQTVKDFVETHTLAPLSKREALKRINKIINKEKR